MYALKRTVWLASLFLGSVTSLLSHSEEPIISTLEWRLEQLKLISEEQRLHRLFELYWDWTIEEDPLYASYLGIKGYNDRWPDLSFSALERRVSSANQMLTVLLTIDGTDLSQEDRISYKILKQNLEAESEVYEYQLNYMPINQMNGIHLEAPFFLSIMPTETLEDYQNILSRLNQYPLLIDQTIELMNKGLEIELTPPRITMRSVPEQVLNQIVDEPLDSEFLKAFNDMPTDFPDEIQNQLLTEGITAYQKQIKPALVKFYRYLVDTYLPSCRSTIGLKDLPNGRERYLREVKQQTTTSLTPEEIHQLGLQEVQRIYQSMLAIKETLQFEGSFAEFIHDLRTNPAFVYTDRESILKDFQQLVAYVQTQLPRLFHKLPSLPCEVIPVPSYSEESQIAAYYYPGSIADQRPGYFFINTAHPENRPVWETEPLALHEALPGHHLQLTIAQEQDQLPFFRQHAHYTAYVEGWGLYAESLGNELGLYTNPYSQFGRLCCEMMRAVRLVVDTGMHALGWTRQQSIDYFKEYVALSEHEAITEIDRYLVMPGQALAYKIGELKIKELRQRAEKILGDQFDIRDFHEEWLKHGALPLDLAEDMINQWIEDQMNSRSEYALESFYTQET